MKKKIVLIVAICLASLIGLFILATADDEEGGADIPISQEVAQQKCSIALPDYADSVYCYWWTGGTQEWEHEARFNIPKNKEKDYVDSLLFDKKDQGEKFRVLGDQRIHYAKKSGPRRKWWDINEEFKGVYMGVEKEYKLSENYWIDTTTHRVYVVLNH